METPSHGPSSSPAASTPGAPKLNVVVPGTLDRPTGGDRYDARMVVGLRDRGWGISVHGLEGDFPRSDAAARDDLDSLLAELQDGSRVLVDGLVMGGLPDPVRRHGERLRILALVHHPLADETGRADDDREELLQSETRALEAARGAVVTSPYTARRVEDLFGIPGNRIRVAIPGTDPAPRARGPAADEPPLLLCVGSVIPRKGHDVLIEALEALREHPWRLTCVGSLTADPEFTDEVRNGARRAGISERIRFTGAVSTPDLHRMFYSSSIFVLPSHYEGYGMSLAEAMARGLPIVSTTGGAIPDTVPDDAGLLVPPGDVGALGAALEALLGPRGPDRRRRLARASREHGVGLPTWNEAAAVLERGIVELAGPGGPNGAAA